MVSKFYGTEVKIWAGFGSVGNTEKEIGADNEQLLRSIFSCFQGQNSKFFKKIYCSICTKKLHKIKVRKKLLWIFYWLIG